MIFEKASFSMEIERCQDANAKPSVLGDNKDQHTLP